jgi:hypothetical protein
LGSVAFSTKAIGYRLECDKTILESSPYSIGFTTSVSAEKWNCLLGNTLNTIEALGHLQNNKYSRKGNSLDTSM